MEIMSFNGLLVDFVRANEASVVVRGLRACLLYTSRELYREFGL